MDEQNEYAKAVTPPAQFHTMHLSEGWAPLCKILAAQEPDEPFPRANDAEAVDSVAGQIMWEAGWRWGVIVSALTAAAYGARLYVSRR